MRIELWIILVTGALIYNAYYENFLGKMIKSNMKYIKIAGIGLGGLLLYIFFKRNPNESQSLIKHASQLIKYMPIDKNSKELVAPFIDLTQTARVFPENINEISNEISNEMTPQMKRMLHSGGVKTPGQQLKRSVSNTKKKYVASNQGWKCGHCQSQLDMAYEVDHIVELQHGGTNEVTNLVALCRNCHGKKTMMNRM